MKPDLPREIFRAAVVAGDQPVVLAMRSNGSTVTAAQRDELLAAAVARQYVELEVDLLAYEQLPGKQNRNGVRFRDGAMTALGRSGTGTPYLRDHLQSDVTSRGGTITKSAARKLEQGGHQILQTVTLTDPAAVERALRGLMSSVSIGWVPTGPVNCSLCGTEILSACWHWPLDVIAGADGAPDQIVEWVFTSADLVETSEVSVPAVPRARIEAVRAAALAAAGTPPRGAPPHSHGAPMTALLMKLTPILGLAATAGEDDAVRAVESLRERLRLTEGQRDEHASQMLALAAQLAGFEQAMSKAAEETFIEEGIRTGKIITGSNFETQLRAYYGKDPEGAKALLASSPVVTPVGQPPQRGAEPPAAGPGTGAGAPESLAAADLITKYNGAASLDGVAQVLASMGLKDPMALINKHLGKGA